MLYWALMWQKVLEMYIEFSCCISYPFLFSCYPSLHKQLCSFIKLKTSWLKTTIFVILWSLLVGIWGGLAGSPDLRSLISLQSKHPPGLQPSQSHTGKQWLLSSLTWAHKLYVLAACWHETLVSCHVDVPIMILVRGSFPLRVERERQRHRERSQFLQPNLRILSLPSRHFYYVFNRSNSYSRGD